MTEKLNIVFEYLQGKIADLKDVNRQHIKIKSVSDSVKKDYIKTRTIIYSIDNSADYIAYWKEYIEADGTKCDFIQLS